MSTPLSSVKPQERARQARIVQAAETMLAQDGEQGLQMKQLAQRAGVALGTLYRYFPSKDHVLGAIALERYARAAQRIDGRHFEGATPGQRAADVMLREFRAVQRDPEMAAALERVTNAPDRSTSEYIEGIRGVTETLVLAAVGQEGAPVTDEHRNVLPVFLAAASGAISYWLAGVLSADQARTQIRAAAGLFDLPPEIVRQYLVGA